MPVQSILHGAEALVPAKVSLVYDGSYDSQGDKQIEDARPAVALEELPPPQHEADEEHRQGSTEPLMDGHAGDTDVASIQNSQPAIAVNGVMTAAKHRVHQPVSRSVCLPKTQPRMSLPTEIGTSAAVKLTRIGWTL